MIRTGRRTLGVDCFCAVAESTSELELDSVASREEGGSSLSRETDNGRGVDGDVLTASQDRSFTFR